MGLGETDDDFAIALLDVRGDGRIRQIDDHIALTLGAALKIHTPDGFAHGRIDPGGHWRRSGRTRCAGGRFGRLATGTLPDDHEQIVAFDASVVRSQLSQADDQPRTVLGLNDRGAAGIAAAQIPILVRQLTGDPRQVQRNPRRLLCRVTVGLRWRPIERQLQLDTVTGQRGDIQRFEVGRQYHRRQKRYP